MQSKEKKKDNARNNARCMQARKTTHGLDGQHQDVNRTLCGRENQNDRGQRQIKKVRPWCGQPSDRGLLINRTEEQNSQKLTGLATDREPCGNFFFLFLLWIDLGCGAEAFL